MQTSTGFVFQAGEVCLNEKRAIRTALMLGDSGDTLKSIELDDLKRTRRGAMAGERGLCPVGTVAFCRAWMGAVDAPEPAPIDYPDVLKPALHRTIELMRFTDAPMGAWIKPVQTKAWEAHIKQHHNEHPAHEMVWVSEVIPESDWLAEWRVYVVDRQIAGWARYDSRPGPEDMPLEILDAVASWVSRFEASGDAPAGYAMDVARWSHAYGLVEVTDGWALGYYRGTCSPSDYAHLLARRWREIIAVVESKPAASVQNIIRDLVQ